MSTTPTPTDKKEARSTADSPHGDARGGGTFAGDIAVRNIRSVGDLGEFVLSRRKARKLSQQEFADLAGVGRRFVSELERGKRTAEIGKVLLVLLALGIDMIVKDR